MVRLAPEGWLPFIQGSEPRQTALVSFFYADEAIRCGHLRLTGLPRHAARVGPVGEGHHRDAR